MSSPPEILLTIDDPAYPAQLREIAHPPRQLWVRGSPAALAGPCLAVVGTRHPSWYGLAVTKSLISPVVRTGLTIVSGLALGIDGQAHREAVAAGTPTVAVLGCGIDRVYPTDHQLLAEQIVAGSGAIITEFPPGTPPERHHFPQRNRIIAGLSQAVLLVEAGEKSGALITAKFAVEQNRDVLVVPGPITAPLSIGPLNWLKLGATPVTTATDILEVFHRPLPNTAQPLLRYVPRSPGEAALLALLIPGPQHVDELAEKSRLDSSVVSATLSLLEINGAIHHLGGLVYALS